MCTRELREVFMDHQTPIVLLHAFPLDRTMWAAQTAVLAGRRVLAPNLPGFGGRPPVEPSLDDFAAAVIQDMDAEEIERAVVVGLSMGGYVAFRLYDGWPERIAGLVLADTRAGADDDSARERRATQAARARREGVSWLAESMSSSLVGETTRSVRQEVVDTVRRTIADSDPEGVARALLAMRARPDSTAALPDITVPVLAIAGEEDELTPPAEASRIADRVPDGRLAVVPRAGHLSNLENPAAFNEAMLSFVA